jgi:hypothetical protein
MMNTFFPAMLLSRIHPTNCQYFLYITLSLQYVQKPYELFLELSITNNSITTTKQFIR